MDDNENNIPTWGFTYRDVDGAISTKSFEAVSWVRALQEFVHFLKGSGFNLDDDSIQIKDEHYDGYNWFGKCCFAIEQEENDDWSHPDDTDLSMHFCPPFEGNPDDCAFKHREKYEVRDLIEAVERLTQEVEEANHYKKLELKGEAL